MVATRDGLLVGHGSEWRRTLAGEARALVAHEGRIYAATRYGLFASGDRGASWTKELNGEFRALASTASGVVAASRQALYLGASESQWKIAARFGKTPVDVRTIVTTKAGLTIAAKEGLYVVGRGTLQPVETPSHTRERGAELTKLVNDLHTGKFFGNWFVVLSDANALDLVLLSLTGVWVWWYPR